ncbi:hypothetical protein [Parasphingorhabdus pacifica]
MRECGGTARPGVVPAPSETAGTMVAALYGELAPHAWHHPEHDAYQLFHQRALTMGWLDDTNAGGDGQDRTRRAPGLWGMNDAGWGHPLGATGTGLVSWFQVEAGAVADDRPLPVQPFLRCAEDATARAGTLHLTAVQLLLPVQGIDPATRPAYAPVPAMGTRHWFDTCPPQASTPVEVGLDSGQDPAIPAVVEQLTDYLAGLDQDVFVCRYHGLTEREAVPPPPFDDRFWNGPPRHGAVLRGELAEWSCDAVGWLAAAVADATARLAVRSPLLLSLTRSLPPG